MTTTNLSLFVPYLRETYGFSNFMGSAILSVRLFAGTIGMLLIDKVLKKLSPVRCIYLGLLVQVLGYSIWAIAGQRYWLYLVGAVLNGIGYTLGSNVVLSLIIKQWFIKRQGLALSICMAGSSVCAFVLPGISTRLIENYSIRSAFFIEALLILALLILQLMLLRDSPEEKNCSPYNPENLQEKTVSDSGGNAPASALKALFAAMCLLGYASNFASGQIANLYKTVGMDPFSVSRIISFFGIFLFAGKLVFGQYSDKKGCHKANNVFSCILIIAYITECFAFVNSFPLAIISQLLIGIGLPIGTVGITNLIKTCYPAEKYTKYLKTQQAAFMFGGVFSGIVPGWLADITGSYIPGVMIAVASVGVFLLISNIIYKQA